MLLGFGLEQLEVELAGATFSASTLCTSKRVLCFFVGWEDLAELFENLTAIIMTGEVIECLRCTEQCLLRGFIAEGREASVGERGVVLLGFEAC